MSNGERKPHVWKILPFLETIGLENGAKSCVPFLWLLRILSHPHFAFLARKTRFAKLLLRHRTPWQYGVTRAAGHCAPMQIAQNTAG